MWAWLDQLVLILLATLILIIFGWSIYAFFYAIFLFVFSAGDAEKIKNARNSIRYMILWVIFTLALLFVFPVIFKKVGLMNAEMFEASNIFWMAVDIVNYLFSFWKEALTIYNWGEWSLPLPPASWTEWAWSSIWSPRPSGWGWFEL